MENTTLFPHMPLDDAGTRAARERLHSMIAAGAHARDSILRSVNELLIEDALQLPRMMEFTCSTHNRPELCLAPSTPFYRIHPHALGQLCQRVEYPNNYLTKLLNGLGGIAQDVRMQKLESDVSWHLKNLVYKDRKKKDGKFLVRRVGDTIRGIVSSSFKRHLASKPLLRAFLAAADDFKLIPYEAGSSAVAVSLRCLHDYVYEAGGEHLALGVHWTNSDFGAGCLKVGAILMHVKSGISVPMTDAISSVHIGPVIEDDDVILSQDTMQSELDTQAKAIRDAVAHTMKGDTVKAVLEAVAKAKEDKMTWEQIRREIGQVLSRAEMEKLRRVVDGNETLELLPPVFTEDRDVDTNRLWISQLVANFANEHANDDDARMKIEVTAGNILAGKQRRTRKAA